MKAQEKYLQLKFKNYYTTPTQFELSNLHPLDSTQTTLLLKSSLNYLCFANDISPSGSVVFAPLSTSQRLQFPVEDNKNSKLYRFTRPVTDISYNPCTKDTWAISEDLRIHLINLQLGTQSEIVLDKKPAVIEFNPVVQEVLAAGAIDNSLRILDITKEQQTISLQLSGRATNLQWRQDGGYLVAAQQNGSKRQFIIVDPRQGQGMELEMKGNKAITKLAVNWIGNDELLTIVNEAEQERRMILWDQRQMDQPIFEEIIDTNPGQTTPFYDNEAKLLYLTSKGQKSILVYEYLNHEFLHLNFSNGSKQYEGSLPGQGYCLLPKALIEQNGEEFNRMLIMQAKQNKEKIITEISFKQKKFNYLNNFPEYIASEPSMTKQQWYQGNQANPTKSSFLNQQNIHQKISQTKQEQPLVQIQVQQIQNEIILKFYQQVQEEKKQEIPQQIPKLPQQTNNDNQEDLKQEVNTLKSEVVELKSIITDLTNTVNHLKQKLEILTTNQ